MRPNNISSEDDSDAIPEESESETVRESRCIPGNDPTDVNRGGDFVFLNQDAN